MLKGIDRRNTGINGKIVVALRLHQEVTDSIPWEKYTQKLKLTRPWITQQSFIQMVIWNLTHAPIAVMKTCLTPKSNMGRNTVSTADMIIHSPPMIWERKGLSILPVAIWNVGKYCIQNNNTHFLKDWDLKPQSLIPWQSRTLVRSLWKSNTGIIPIRAKNVLITFWVSFRISIGFN